MCVEWIKSMFHEKKYHPPDALCEEDNQEVL